jgi:hypothetical protein
MNTEFPERDLIKIALLDLLWRQRGHQMKESESYGPLAKALDLGPRPAKLPRAYSVLDELAPAWPHHVRWAGQELAMEGYIEKYVPYGIWKLTHKGAETAHTLARVRVPL